MDKEKISSDGIKIRTSSGGWSLLVEKWQGLTDSNAGYDWSWVVEMVERFIGMANAVMP